MYNSLTGWSYSLTKKSFVFAIALIFALYIVLPGKLYAIYWIASALTIYFFTIQNLYSKSISWNSLSEKLFIRKIFWVSLLLRILTMLLLLAISYNEWNLFYYVGAKDEMVYYRVAHEAVAIWENFGFRDTYLHVLTSYRNEISDTGFSVFLAIFFRLFGSSPILIKIFLCFLGSFTVVRGYRLAQQITDIKTSRIAGVMLMLYPISWFYSATLLKEGLIVLIIIESIIQIIRIQRAFKIIHLIKVLVLILLVFFLRSSISILLVMTLIFSMFLQFERRHILINILVTVIVLGIYMSFLQSTGRFDDYYEKYTSANEFSDQRISSMEKINPFVTIAGAPVFIPLAFVAPFPSVVSLPVKDGLSHNEYYYHVAGNLFWITLAFFSFYGVYYALRYNRQKMAPIWAFIIGYQFVLLKAMYFTSVRFSYPLKPLLLIMAAYGLSQMKNKKWYPIYLAGAVVMIVGWNFVRFKGRG